MDYENIIYTMEKRIATIQFNRPDIMNATVDKIIEELKDATLKAASDGQVGALIITGSGKAFSAGGDVEKIQKGFNVLDGKEFLSGSHPWLMQFAQMEKPVIAAVNGFCFGSGFSIALACDFIFAAEEAKFSQAFINLGLVPDMGSMYFLPRLVGLSRAKELIFTGKPLSASEAFEMGIVNRVVAGDQLMSTVKEFAEKLVSGPRVAIKFAKKLLNLSSNINLEEMLEYESYAQSVLFQTEDHREAARAFLEKRPPVFNGR